MARRTVSSKGPRIRRLRDGETPPPGEPRRYLSGSGYVRLRWKVGADELVEVYEHRLVAGARAGEQVHHINHDKTDNRLENLEILTPQEHAAEHGAERCFDVNEAERLYRSGLSTVEIGRILRRDPSNIYRRLAARGVQMRSTGDHNRLSLPSETIARLARQGVRAKAIAAVLGISDGPVRACIRAAGVQAQRDGRPSNAERERQARLLAEAFG